MTLALPLLTTGCGLEPERVPTCGPAPLEAEGFVIQEVTIVAEHPHDDGAFTQGLLFADGAIYESTGLYGASTLRRVELETGVVEQQVALDDALWGEGLALWEDELIQLTWTAGRALTYERDDFTAAGEFSYATEGWGLATTEDGLVMSDGTATLRFLDPETFEERRSVTVTSAGAPVPRLNELEVIAGEIWANVWPTEQIVRIDPQSGQVRGWVLFHGLADDLGLDDPEDVLNGIAYDSESCRVFVTGKRWPKLFEIEVR